MMTLKSNLVLLFHNLVKFANTNTMRMIWYKAEGVFVCIVNMTMRKVLCSYYNTHSKE